MNRDTESYAGDRLLTNISSIVACGDGSVLAVSLGQGVYRICPERGWQKLDDGLPPKATINRLQLCGPSIYACTDSGLFELDGDGWLDHSLTVPCYQITSAGGMQLAATSYGLWSYSGHGWSQLSGTDSIVYDAMVAPQYVIVGHDKGIAVYDRYMSAWTDVALEAGVTSLAIYRGHVIGASAAGKLVVGNKQGGYDGYRFGRMFVYRVVQSADRVYVCTDKGLYRLVSFGGGVRMVAYRLDCPVTDVDEYEGMLYAATLFRGVQRIAK
ncbi:MAG: hypothetical protein J7639_31045 [Paenibacillaceae bacterium]|nr:hypothetical protein [Paenibacillaceae bacterium]